MMEKEAVAGASSSSSFFPDRERLYFTSAVAASALIANFFVVPLVRY
jgi:hypothetical protein